MMSRKLDLVRTSHTSRVRSRENGYLKSHMATSPFCFHYPDPVCPVLLGWNPVCEQRARSSDLQMSLWFCDLIFLPEVQALCHLWAAVVGRGYKLGDFQASETRGQGDGGGLKRRSKIFGKRKPESISLGRLGLIFLSLAHLSFSFCTFIQVRSLCQA